MNLERTRNLSVSIIFDARNFEWKMKMETPGN